MRAVIGQTDGTSVAFSVRYGGEFIWKNDENNSNAVIAVKSSTSAKTQRRMNRIALKSREFVILRR
jgi:hypothetical protein